MYFRANHRLRRNGRDSAIPRIRHILRLIPETLRSRRLCGEKQKTKMGRFTKNRKSAPLTISHLRQKFWDDRPIFEWRA
jgi:hypothetical protein